MPPYLLISVQVEVLLNPPFEDWQSALIVGVALVTTSCSTTAFVVATLLVLLTRMAAVQLDSVPVAPRTSRPAASRPLPQTRGAKWNRVVPRCLPEAVESAI